MPTEACKSSRKSRSTSLTGHMEQSHISSNSLTPYDWSMSQQSLGVWIYLIAFLGFHL